MTTHLYLSMIPESLVASMLPPDEFGRYLAVGTRKQSRARPCSFTSMASLPATISTSRSCAGAASPRRRKAQALPLPGHLPRHGARPLDAVGSLWLVTPEARVLELHAAPLPPEFPGKYHLYQEICPVHP